MNRKASQAISAYVAERKELSRTCAFGETEDGVTLTSQLILYENLRDCFFVWIGGCYNSKTIVK